MNPTVGRMVYFKTRGSLDGKFPPTDFASIITAVNADISTVCLATFGPSGLRFETDVEQGQEPGQWDWMPFQKDQQARLAPGTAVNKPGQAGSNADTSAEGAGSAGATA